MPCYVTANRNTDLADTLHGTLYGFRYHREPVEVDWFSGEVRVAFPRWGVAKAAVAALKAGDPTAWDHAVMFPAG